MLYPGPSEGGVLMAEYIRSIKIDIEVDTNKRTISASVDAEDFFDALVQTAEELNELAEIVD